MIHFSNSILKLLPICEVCKKPVDRMVAMESLETGNFRFLVFCHGFEEMMEIARYDVIHASRINRGTAFRTYPKLEELK